MLPEETDNWRKGHKQTARGGLRTRRTVLSLPQARALNLVRPAGNPDPFAAGTNRISRGSGVLADS